MEGKHLERFGRTELIPSGDPFIIEEGFEAKVCDALNCVLLRARL